MLLQTARNPHDPRVIRTAAPRLLLIYINLGIGIEVIRFAFDRRDDPGRLGYEVAMAETPKLSVEKALEKLRKADAPKSGNARRTEEMDALDDEVKRSVSYTHLTLPTNREV